MKTLFFSRDLAYRQYHRGCRHVGDRINALAVVPLASDGGADIRHVLVVGRDDLDLHVRVCFGEVVDRLLYGDNGAFSTGIRVDAGHVVEDADLDVNRLG